MDFTPRRMARGVRTAFLLALLGLILSIAPAAADDLSELKQQVDLLQQRLDDLENGPDEYGAIPMFAFSGLLSAAYQFQLLDPPDNILDGGHGGLAFQPEVSVALSERDELSFKFGFAAGNGLNNASPFALAPWAAPLEDDVKNINGRNRDYLLTAWYAHTFALGADSSLQLTGGLIDVTDYLDENAFANDEQTQFMNEALVNASNGFLPSFDLGGAAVLELGRFEISAVGMHIAENDYGFSYNFYGAELEYELETAAGEGGYRVIVGYATEAFPDPAALNQESRFMLMFSFDQTFGEAFGAWTRFGYQTDKCKVDFGKLISGGVDLRGSLWGRAEDNVGIGYAYLNDGNQNLTSSQVLEAYYRLVCNDAFALTVDAQYLDDNYVAGSGPSAYVFGARGTVEF